MSRSKEENKKGIQKQLRRENKLPASGEVTKTKFQGQKKERKENQRSNTRLIRENQLHDNGLVMKS